MDPKWRNVIVVVIVVALVASGAGVYYIRQANLANTNASNCRLGSTDPVKVDQSEIPDSLDPAGTFSTPGWAAVQQVYQGLVNYNGSSVTNFTGVLAQNWSISADHFHYNFTLRPGIHFSNGDPVNAYVLWYSLYRALLLAQGPQFILEENFFSPSLNASYGLNYYSNLTLVQAANATLQTDLNTWNFDVPTAPEIALMGLPNQSFTVLNPSTIQLNLGMGYLGTPYTYLLATLSSPVAYVVDPAWIDQNGGVQADTPNSNLAVSMMGTGQFILANYNGVPGGSYLLKPDPNYWGRAAAAAEPWNNLLQPANTSFEVVFQDSQQITINDLEEGSVGLASFAYLGPSTIQELQGHACVVVKPLPTVYGSTGGSWWIYLNQQSFPFDNLSVRMAIAHAINYQQIINEAFGGYGSQWVGPVPPAYPNYNPQGLAPYAYNQTLAKAEIADSPCAPKSNLCSRALSFSYLDVGTDWSEMAQLVVSDLSAIGLTITPIPITLDNLYEEQALNAAGTCTTLTSTNGGPFPMGLEFYTSDYVAPDDWTQNDALSTGSANHCMSGYDNSTVDQDVYAGASEFNSTALNSTYSQMTQLMYDNYTDIWLIVPTSISVYAAEMHGIDLNPMGSAEPYALQFNTQWAS
jgi:ABC-type transport system substrate-binding protein